MASKVSTFVHLNCLYIAVLTPGTISHTCTVYIKGFEVVDYVKIQRKNFLARQSLQLIICIIAGSGGKFP